MGVGGVNVNTMQYKCTLIHLRLAGLPDSASLRLINVQIDVHGLM